jgi:prepilin-type N-terminal cleavage/methylation domain-containing protein
MASFRGIAREDGYTLPELLIALLLGLVVIGAGVRVLTSSVSTEPRARDRAALIQDARTMSERLTRELRQASDATSPTPTQLTVLTYVPHTAACDGTARTDTSTAVRCRVFYSCTTAGTCTRTECPTTTLATATPTAPPCGPTVQVIDGLASDQVFAFSPRTPGHSYVALALSFPAEDGGDAITIEDGAALRNPPLGAS